MAETISTIRNRVKRLLSSRVASGVSDNDIDFYVQDAVGMIELDYPAFTNYVVIAGTSIAPEPDHVDSVLIATKGASLVVNSLNQRAIGDAVLIRTGGITLDTSKSLRARGIEANRFERMYDGLLQSLIINGKGSSTTTYGYRIDNYIETNSQIGNISSDSLWLA